MCGCACDCCDFSDCARYGSGAAKCERDDAWCDLIEFESFGCESVGWSESFVWYEWCVPDGLSERCD